jgi:hypothetical protein
VRPSKRPARALRGFRIADALIAIAATAIGLTWARDDWEWIRGFGPPKKGWGDLLATRATAYDWTRSAASSAIHVGAALACSWGVALLAIRRNRIPRLPLWRARRPGAVACLAATSVLALLLIAQSIRPYRDALHISIGRYGEFRAITTGPYGGGRRVGDLDPLLNTLLQVPRVAGFVVAGAWIALGIAGRWRPEAGWIDRLGRAVGVFWIVGALYFLFFPL